MSGVRTWVIAGVLTVSFGGGIAFGTDDRAGAPESPIKGRLLFEEKHCNACHGLPGEGEGIGPDLGGGNFSGSFLDLGAALWNHVPAMSVALEDVEIPWPTLSPSETSQLIAFLYFIDYLGEPGVADSGRRVFLERGCSGCHRIGNEGEAVGPDLTSLNRFASPLYIAQAVWNHGPAMFEAMREQLVAPPTFKPGDLADLSAYIREIGPEGSRKTILLAPGNPERGRELFGAKGCEICHVGGDDAPDLGELELPRSAEAIAGTMWNHAMAMNEEMESLDIGWPHLTTPELADLTSYLYFLPFADPPGEAERGEQIFAARSCLDCHSDGTDSTHPGPDLAGADVTSTPAALVSAMWNHAPTMKEAVLSEGRPWPELGGDDLRDLFAYLRRQTSSP